MSQTQHLGMLILYAAALLLGTSGMVLQFVNYRRFHKVGLFLALGGLAMTATLRLIDRMIQ